MSDHDVNIKVPPVSRSLCLAYVHTSLLCIIYLFQSEAQSNIVTVTGPPPNVEEAKKALLDKLGELEAEKADKVSHYVFSVPRVEFLNWRWVVLGGQELRDQGRSESRISP